MESNDYQEINKMLYANNDKNLDKSTDISKTVKSQEQPMDSKLSTSKNTNKSFERLSKRARIISGKLAKTRKNLEIAHLKNKESNKIKESGKNAFIVLETTPRGMSNEARQRKKDIKKPLTLHTKEELIELVQSLHTLILALTLDNKDIMTKAKGAAQNIYGLKEFPLFPKELNNKTNELLNKSMETPGSCEVGNQNILKEKKKKLKQRKRREGKPSQEQKFAKYINAILANYVSKVNPIKCFPWMVEDLEPLVTLLVEKGYGCIVEKEIRINPKNYYQAFIRMTEDRTATDKDAIIISPIARRYAFDGDIVRAFVFNSESVNASLTNNLIEITKGENELSLDENEETCEDGKCDILSNSAASDVLLEKENCRNAFVIRIVKQIEDREIVGSVSFLNTKNLNSKSYYKLVPHDVRLPMLFIPEESCKEENNDIRNEDICGIIYVARVLSVDINGNCIGELVQPVGKVGNLQAEIKAILWKNGLKDIKPYEEKHNKIYEAPTTPGEDLRCREDLRQKCIFTIDPITAQDLDDAISIEKINNIEYEIGVHISDVSFYLEENSEVDNLVKTRATSIYLVNEVIHMLPKPLCFKCSLLPGKDKLAFSIFWKWNTEREEMSAPRFTRSIINSCSQLAYQHVQKILDNPLEDLNENEIPNLLNDWTPNDIKWRVLLLHNVAQTLKAKRFENGALSINTPKLRFQLHPETGEPTAFEIEDRQEANFLIEEFMLLANQSVAKFIRDCFPDKAILRNHSPPLTKNMKALKKRFNNLGLDFDISSSKSISDSIHRLISESNDSKAVEVCLSTLLVKSLARANYYCSAGISSDTELWHYALSVPIYTHFTSPIRRYPDIMVHRLLAAALNYCQPPQRTTEELHHIVKICNDQKLNAKNAGDESIQLFFKRYLKAKQSIKLKSVVTEIGDHCLNVSIIETGHNISILYKEQKCIVNPRCAPKSVDISANESSPKIKLQLFSTIDVCMVLCNNKLSGFFDLPLVTK